MGLSGFWNNLFGTTVRQKCLYHRDDLTATIIELELGCHDQLLFLKKGEKDLGYPFDPDLLIPLKIGNTDYGLVYPISSRTPVIDLLGVTGDRWSDENLWKTLKGIASEEQHAVQNVKYQTKMEKATYPLAIAAGVMVVIMSLVAAWGYYQSVI